MIDPVHSATSLLRHVATDKAAHYRAIMETFAAAKRQFRLQLRPDEVQIEARWPGATPSLDDIQMALTQLADWGNLEVQPDTARVSSIEDFYRARYLYRLSLGGEAVEAALLTFAQTLARQSELQTVALEDILTDLNALIALAAEPVPDAAKVHTVLRDLVRVFERLDDEAQAFMAGVARAIELQQAEIQAVIPFKQRLIDYLQRFVGDLVARSGIIAARIIELDAVIESLLMLAAGRERRDSAPGASEAAALEARLVTWRERWRGLSRWFISDGHIPAQSELLRARVRSAIPQLLAVAARPWPDCARACASATLRDAMAARSRWGSWTPPSGRPCAACWGGRRRRAPRCVSRSPTWMRSCCAAARRHRCATRSSCWMDRFTISRPCVRRRRWNGATSRPRWPTAPRRVARATARAGRLETRQRRPVGSGGPAVWRRREGAGRATSCPTGELEEGVQEESARTQWAAADILVNALARPALALNLPGDDTRCGEPDYLSLRALVRQGRQRDVAQRDVFVCENPNIVAIAADALGRRCAPLVCTDGMPAAAQQTLLSQLAAAGARLHYHGDFDWPGIAIANVVIQEFGALPWRFGAQDYRAAVNTAAVSSRRLALPGRDACWDDGLKGAMLALGIPVDEEAVADLLLEDLLHGA